MGTRGRSTRWLLIALLLFVTISAAVLWSAAGDPALVVAARDRDAETVRTLLAKRADVNEQARDGSTALLWAVYHSDLEMAHALIAAGANFNTPNRTASRRCCRPAAPAMRRIIAELLKAGADVSRSVIPRARRR